MQMRVRLLVPAPPSRLAANDPLATFEFAKTFGMNEESDSPIRGKDLAASQFLRLLIVGSVPSGNTAKLVVNTRQKKIMNVVGAHLPILFLVLFVTGFVNLSWPNVSVFLGIVVVIYAVAIRSAVLEEEKAY